MLVAGCHSADPLHGLFMPKSDGWKIKHTFPVKSPLVAVACSGVNPPCARRSSAFHLGWDWGKAGTRKMLPLTLVPA